MTRSDPRRVNMREEHDAVLVRRAPLYDKAVLVCRMIRNSMVRQPNNRRSVARTKDEGHPWTDQAPENQARRTSYWDAATAAGCAFRRRLRRVIAGEFRSSATDSAWGWAPLAARRAAFWPFGFRIHSDAPSPARKRTVFGEFIASAAPSPPAALARSMSAPPSNEHPASSPPSFDFGRPASAASRLRPDARSPA